MGDHISLHKSCSVAMGQFYGIESLILGSPTSLHAILVFFPRTSEDCATHNVYNNKERYTHQVTVILHSAKYTDVDEETTVPIDEHPNHSQRKTPAFQQKAIVKNPLDCLSFLPHSLCILNTVSNPQCPCITPIFQCHQPNGTNAHRQCTTPRTPPSSQADSGARSLP